MDKDPTHNIYECECPACKPSLSEIIRTCIGMRWRWPNCYLKGGFTEWSARFSQEEKHIEAMIEQHRSEGAEVERLFNHSAAVPVAEDALHPGTLMWLAGEVAAIDTWYRGSPSYEHDAAWMKDRVLRLIRETHAALAADQSGDAK